MYSYPYPYSAPVPPMGASTEAGATGEASTSGVLNLAFVRQLRDDWRFGLAAGGALCVGLAAWGLGDSWRPAFPQGGDDPAAASSPWMSEADAVQTTAPRFHIIANEAPPPPLPVERPVRAVMDTQDADTATDPQAPASAEAADATDAAPRVTRVSLATASDTCAGLAAVSARMLCASPDLADRDRRLRIAYGRALETSSDPNQLQAEQTRWTTLRDQAAASGGETAVAALYDRRIQSLDTPD